MNTAILGLDSYAHSNPAFGALCLHWMTRGYQEEFTKSDSFPESEGLLPLWGMLGLGLLAPDSSRKKLPLTSQSKLTILLDKNQDWRSASPTIIANWAPAFWEGVRFGVATGTLTMAQGRLRTNAAAAAANTSEKIELRKKCLTWGKMLARERSDSRIALIFGVEVVR